MKDINPRSWWYSHDKKKHYKAVYIFYATSNSSIIGMFIKCLCQSFSEISHDKTTSTWCGKSQCHSGAGIQDLSFLISSSLSLTASKKNVSWPVTYRLLNANCGDSIAVALELPEFCTKPSISLCCRFFIVKNILLYCMLPSKLFYWARPSMINKRYQKREINVESTPPAEAWIFNPKPRYYRFALQSTCF